jgi:CheY-like chemotaxis protein
VITDMDGLLRRLIGEDIDLVTAPSAGLGHVKADPNQLEQVLMNLVVNARDAMPAGGKLTIETGNVDLDDEFAGRKLGVKSGPYVMVAVSDTGTGISPEVKARLFEPFFTTKERGRGTGLGLSTVHGIVQQSEGHIEVYSEPGQGSTFKVYLPRVEAELDEPERRAPEPESLRGDEVLLLVEDDETIRRVVRESLEQLGYKVLEAADGHEAMIRFKHRTRPVQLLITDVIMPGMSGPELAEMILAIQPQLSVLFVSGYTDRALVHQGLRRPGTAFLQKPFSPEALARRVREVLDEAAARHA